MTQKYETERLSLFGQNAGRAISRAVELLRAGEPVAIPTETVYGLAADATNGEAVARIFAAKGRPAFNPLIAHVANRAAAENLVDMPEWAQKLADLFWPGPLTMVLPMRAGAVHPLVTAGLPTLAVRVPAHLAAQGVLRTFDGPLAAPSANPSGRISPTTADHVLAGLDSRIAAVLDAGPCQVGLESTIIGGHADQPAILREGGLARDLIEAAIGPLAEAGEGITAPGQLASHYAPRQQMRLNALSWQTGESRLGFGAVDCDLNLSPTSDLAEAAANLFDHLHKLEGRPKNRIAVSPIPESGLGLAINDRLRRAAAPRPE